MKRRFFTNKAIWIIIGQLLLFSLQPVYAGESEFRLVGPIRIYSRSQQIYLGIFPSSIASIGVQDWARGENPESPADYFRSPEGADTTNFTDAEFSEIESLLTRNIRATYYDDFVLENLTGYEFTMGDSGVWRRECYVKYARGDTVYVLSGWLGKFLSFYRAVPGDFRYDATNLQKEVEKISPSFMIAKEKAFKRIDEEINYFLEYVDKPNKMRIRNYQIYARFMYGVSGDREKKYNLIEITKFIDPEVMP